MAGPFRGMKLELSPLSQRHLMGYILGSQEHELREVTERIIARGYRKILNIGAADGYYAVGLAFRSPVSEIVAFEALPELHDVVKRAAEANGVNGRIRMSGRCESSDLRRELRGADGTALVFADIEGGEIDLLDPVREPALLGADIFVETHDSFVAGCTETLIERFQATHNIEQYQARRRGLSDYPSDFMPALPRLFPRLVVDLMDERRQGLQRWLYLTVKQIVGGDAPISASIDKS
jgi:hypothetical protein